jgi:hypothetical protein
MSALSLEVKSSLDGQIRSLRAFGIAIAGHGLEDRDHG